MVELLEKFLALSLKLDLVFPHQTLAEEVVFLLFLIKKQILSWIYNISWVVKFLESTLAFSLKQYL